jgi:hypothetical protein
MQADARLREIVVNSFCILAGFRSTHNLWPSPRVRLRGSKLTATAMRNRFKFDCRQEDTHIATVEEHQPRSID